MKPEYLEQLADIADPDKLWRRGMWVDLPPKQRHQLDTGVALRRYADHLGRLAGLREEKRSLLITPLTENGSAIKSVDTPADHARLRDARGAPRFDDVPPVDEKKKFETAMRELHPEWSFTPDPVFVYHNERTRFAWEGWSAARGPAAPEAPSADFVKVLRRAHITFNQVEIDAHAQDALFEWWGEIADRLSEIRTELAKHDAGTSASADISNMTLDAMIAIWSDALDGKPWPEEHKAPRVRELYERTLAALGASIAEHLFIDDRGDGKWLVCVEKVYDTQEEARESCRKWIAAAGGVPGSRNAGE